jgi:hypothetical protein
MESRLYQPPLPQPVGALAGQQAVAKKPSIVAENAVFMKALIVGNQHRLDQIRAIDKENANPGSPVVKDISKFTGPLGKHCKRLRAGQGQVADQEMRLGTGRPSVRDFGHLRK